MAVAHSRPSSTAVQITAQETLAPGDPVTVTGWKANSSDPSRDFGRVAGICKTGASVGFNVEAVLFGEVRLDSWAWTPGSPVFLNGQSLSHTPPVTGFIALLGVAKTTDLVEVGIEPTSVLL